MKLTDEPQTIWHGAEVDIPGDIRRIRAHKTNGTLWLERQVLTGITWCEIMGGLAIRNREQALAVREAIDAYLGTQPVVGVTAQEERDALASVLAIVSVQLVAVVEAMSLLSDPSSEDAIRQGMAHASRLTGPCLGDCLAAIDKDLRDICTSLKPTRSWAQRQKLNAAWPLIQAAYILAGHCRQASDISVMVSSTFVMDALGNGPYYPQSKDWIKTLLADADRVTALLEGVTIDG